MLSINSGNSTIMPKNFTFIRVVPLTNWGKGLQRSRSRTGRGWGVTGCAAHDLRFLITPNADARMIGKNAFVSAKTGWEPMSATKENLATMGITGPEYLAEMAKDMIAEKGIKLKKTHVKVSMLMCAVSPEFLRDGDTRNKLNNKKVRKWAEGTIKYLREKYGDRLLSIVIHLDELNPHASAYVVPMLEKKIKAMGRPANGMVSQPRESNLEWRMSHKDLFTRDKRILEVDLVTEEVKLIRIEPGSCSQMQDDYAETLKMMGLDVQRGIRKSDEQKALDYETTKERYRRLSEPVMAVENLSDQELRQWVVDNAPAVEEAKRLRIQCDHYQIAGGASQQQVVKLEQKIAESKRELPVADVIRAITGTEPTQPDDGCEDGGSDKNIQPGQLEFRLKNGQRLKISSGNRFTNLTPHIPFKGKATNRLSGRGAVDAVVYLTGCSFDAAVARLSQIFGGEDAQRSAAQKLGAEIAAIKAALEAPVTEKWPEVAAKLKTWDFNEAAIKSAFDCSRIAANSEGHIIFTKEHWNKRDMDLSFSGNIVIDMEFPEVDVLESGDNGLFMLLDAKATHNVICASPMDALAIKSRPEHEHANVIAVGSKPNEQTQNSIRILINTIPNATRFADNLTENGRFLAAWLAEIFADKIQTIPLPPSFRHWLDYHFATIKTKQEKNINSFEPNKKSENPN